MAPRGRYAGRHRAPLRLLPALIGSGALLVALVGAALALSGPSAAPAPAGGSPTAGAADVTGSDDTAAALSGDTPSSRITPPGSPHVFPRSAAAVADASAANRPAAARAAVPAPRTSPESDRITALESLVALLINRERDRAGCGRLHTDAQMADAARRHSTDMARYDYFSHTGRNGSSFVDRLEDAGYPRRHAAGENIAYGYSTAQAVVDAWMASTGHRNNILNCDARATGVGLAYQERRAYWTQEFGRE
ncbi:CAP domain-containing protein [Catellatospora sp. NPDC049111]|uniref:CAP domain-containing protein n=1 Tax=Catellatospora sp. NPDC049111 TaxID=3155271 RepID=UPI0033F84711